MALFGDLRRRWLLAKWLAEAEDNGKMLIAVPDGMAAQVHGEIWRHNVEAASERWATKIADVSLDDWQEAVLKLGRHRKGQPRER